MIKIIKYIICFTLYSFLFVNVFAQPLPVNTEYINNKPALSYAYSGYYGDFNSSVTYRANWLGFQGAPEYIKGKIDVPLPYSAGLGISVMNYKVGIFKDFATSADYSFMAPLQTKHILYFGLRAQYYRSSLDIYKTKPSDISDPVFQYNLQSERANKFNTGFSIAYNYEDIFAGFSVSNLSKKEITSGSIHLPIYREFKMFGNYSYTLSNEWELEGFAFFSKIKESKALFEITALGKYNKDLWTGISWRRPLNFSINVGKYINDDLYFNYTAGITGEPGFSNTLGSHEITVGYRLSKGAKWLGYSTKKSGSIIEKLIELITNLF